MVTEIKIRNKKIGGKNPVFVIAEIGINHNNDINIAKKMIDSAANAGCDAVKMQAFKAERMYPRSAGNIDWKDNEKEYSYDIFEANKSFEVPDDWWKELSDYAHNKGLIFFSSVCDEKTADYVDKYLDIFKTTSFAITHLPLLKHIATHKKPIMFATGTANMQEIEEAYNTVKDINDKVMILHCISQYPMPLENANIATIDFLKEKFSEAIVGFSDHSEEVYDAAVAAVVHGAKIIEKHMTLNRTMKGPDHFFALEPQMLKEVVDKIRETENLISKGAEIKINPVTIGVRERKLTESELYMREFARRSVMTTESFKKGKILTKKDIIVLRNGKKKPGLEPKWYDIISKGKYKLIRDVEKEHPLLKEDIEEI